MDKVQIGNTIQQRRQLLQLKQEDLAEMSGVNSRTIYQVENGLAKPSMETLAKLLNVLGLAIKVKIKEII